MKFFVFLFAIFFAFSAKSASFDEILTREYINCGIYKNETDINFFNNSLDTTMCRILSTALFNDANSVELVTLGGNFRFDALSDGTVDILFAAPTWTIEREIERDLEFSNVYLFENQQLVTFDKNINSIKDVKENSIICSLKDTTSYTFIKKFIKRLGTKKIKILSSPTNEVMKRSFIRGDCNLLTEESSTLEGMFTDIENLEQFHLLSEYISISPLSSVVKNNKNLKKLAFWLVNGLLRAEEKGITKNNIDTILNNTNDKEILFMFGKINGMGKPFNIDDKWLYNIIKKYGNYDEILDNLYYNTKKKKVKRAKNKLSKKGGVFFTHPFY